ncbi:G2H3 [Mytilus coruscus]|uniref:G2H3 n=1 Tax=Mytilus coruscus TaxID=42192 RepID=A0A6J8BXV1_MYTCO|nr:G2H3 [Mytilus coruscus]
MIFQTLFLLESPHPETKDNLTDPKLNPVISGSRTGSGTHIFYRLCFCFLNHHFFNDSNEQTARQVQAFVEAQRHENVPQTNVSVAANQATNFNDARKTVGVDKKKKKAKGRPTDVVQLKITCLSIPHTTQVNRLDIGRLKRMGLGYPDDEITPSKRVPSRLPTTMTPQEFKEFLKISFPPLRNAGYDLAYATQNTLFLFQEEINTPALIKQYLIKSARSLSIFVRPRVDLSSVCIQGSNTTEKPTSTISRRAVQLRKKNTNGRPRQRIPPLSDAGPRKSFEDNLYFLTGQLFAMSLVFGGPAPAMMSPLMRKFVLSTDPVPTIDDIKDPIFYGQIKELADAQTAEEACNLLEKSETLHQLMGISKSIRNKQDKENLIQKMLNFVMIENMKAAYNEFFLRFSKLGVLEAIRERPDLMESVLVAKEQNITARTMRTYFKHIFFSEVGSNHHKLEVQRICWLEDFFVEIENETVKSTFKDIFAFTTGLKSPPPLGLNPEPSIAFLHVENLNHRLEKKDRFLPVANTCISQIKNTM